LKNDLARSGITKNAKSKLLALVTIVGDLGEWKRVFLLDYGDGVSTH
jgi:hypothetical protein